MAKLPTRVYHSLQEFEADAENATKEALKDTLAKAKKVLRELIEEDIYQGYNPTWYKDKRSYSLLDDSTIEDYIYKNTKNAIGGGIRFNKDYYDSTRDKTLFRHGNDWQFLPFNSFLEIMNDSSKLSPNPYHFPIIDRMAFYDSFLLYLDLTFERDFKDNFDKYMASGGSKPKPKAIPSSFNYNNSMNLSSSTSQYRSIDSGRTNFEREVKKY